jgi:hypothetical protein
LGVTLYVDKTSSAPFHQPLFIFADDPFIDREEWLKGLRIHLFDPNDTTSAIFEKHCIPFRTLATPAAIDALCDGVLVVGEGISWSDYSGAVQAAQRGSRRGLRALCLAPKEGEIALYSETSDGPTDISTMIAARENVLHRFDKRFDRRIWLGGPSVVTRLGFVTENDAVLARVSESLTAWPWLEINYGDSAKLDGGGALIVCGFGIIKYWDDGPVPRYLFREMLEPPALDRK